MTSRWRAFAALLAICGAVPLLAADPPKPWVDRILPLGARAGSTVTVELHGEYLSNVTDVQFDSAELRWLQTKEADSGHVVGVVEIAASAALGPHRLRILTRDGPSNSRLFNVTQFPGVTETEPNDRLHQAQPIDLKPQVLHGYMLGRIDIDTYTFNAKEGERWVFDLRSMEYGSHLESELGLFDSGGNRVAFNDDRDDIDETPLIEHTFAASGSYSLQLDQYRGPQNVDCGRNCGYMLRVSQLPVLQAVSPLGTGRGATVHISLVGTALDSVDSVYLLRVRGAENYRMTYPFTMPIDVGPDPERSADIPRIDGEVINRSGERLDAQIEIPPDTEPGLWRIWVAGPNGATDGLSFEITDKQELSEADGRRVEPQDTETIINASLGTEGEEDTYTLQARSGEPLQIRTLAAQLGLPYIDTVLELFDTEGKLVAEHDDVMTGQGTVVGNPDSSLFYVPENDEPLKLVVRDRIGRGGPTFQYRLKIRTARPTFQLLVEPENLTVQRGGASDLSVLLVRQPGFDEAVEVWAEGLPGQGEKTISGSFRADQVFGPSADGDNIIIPELKFRIEAPESLAAGAYPFRVKGRAGSGGPVVDAHTSLWIGPPRQRNDTRRPLPRIAMHVVEPFAARLTSNDGNIRLKQGETTEIEVSAEHLTEDAEIRVANVPSGVHYRVVSRTADTIVLAVEAGAAVEPGRTTVSVEANVGGRWAATAPMTLTVSRNESSLSAASR